MVKYNIYALHVNLTADFFLDFRILSIHIAANNKNQQYPCHHTWLTNLLKTIKMPTHQSRQVNPPLVQTKLQ